MADILNNPKARRDYEILETYEAGLVLRGTEVKSLRAGKGQLSDAYVRVEKDKDEVWLHNAHIDEYTQGNQFNHVPKAARKLLLNKSEIRKLREASHVKGHALIPISFYWKGNRVKVAVAVGKSKAQFDKRQDMKKRDSEREMKRAETSRIKGR
ncbi:MAG: SsrA-binding protein SmpB [Verrucomicrobia bacterium]|nr:SsrA-binding protein SmpB [Verrucomicrobiota bacterium]